MRKINYIFAFWINRIIAYLLLFVFLYLILNEFVFPEISFFISALIPLLLIDSLRINSKWFYSILADWKKQLKNILSSFLIFFLNLGIFYIIIIISSGKITLSNNQNISLQLDIAFILLLSAIAEEILFRGILFSSIKDRYGSWIAIFITSLLFSSVHIFNNNFNYLAFINTFLAGVLFSLLIIKTNSLIPSIIIHFFWNFSLIFLLDSPLSGFNYSINIFNVTYPHLTILFGDNYGLESGFITTFLLFWNIDLSQKLFFESPFITSKLFIRNYYESKLQK
jgi:membrane protease YdiL (CAAX protease family)